MQSMNTFNSLPALSELILELWGLREWVSPPNLGKKPQNRNPFHANLIFQKSSLSITGWPKWTWKTSSWLSSDSSVNRWAATVCSCLNGRLLPSRCVTLYSFGSEGDKAVTNKATTFGTKTVLQKLKVQAWTAQESSGWCDHWESLWWAPCVTELT